MIPADFSAFNNFNIARHSYWEKTPEEINAFLTTGQFPERVQANAQQTASSAAAVASSYGATVTQQPYVAPTQPAAAATIANPTINTTAANTAPFNAGPVNAASEVTNAAPTRNFSGFSF